MKDKIFKLIITLLLTILLVLVNTTYFNVFMDRVCISKCKIILLDPGHGGRDGGAIGKDGTIERDINLKIAKMLKGYLESSGYICFMTRETDEGLYDENAKNKKDDDLKKRKNMIKEYMPDAFISIHLNSFGQSKYYGGQVFYPKNDDQSKEMAELIQNEFRDKLNRGNERLEKESDSYYILKDNEMPSVIVECGFLSNPQEEKLLNDEIYQNKIAFAIYCGILKYFSKPQ